MKRWKPFLIICICALTAWVLTTSFFLPSTESALNRQPVPVSARNNGKHDKGQALFSRNTQPHGAKGQARVKPAEGQALSAGRPAEGQALPAERPKTRRRLEHTEMKYPLLLVEEEVAVDRGTGTRRVLGKRSMVADHMIVRLRDGLTQKDLEALNAKYGTHIRKRMLAPRSYLVAFEAKDVDTLEAMLKAYRHEAEVVTTAEPDYVVHAIDTMPDDSAFSQLWGLHNTGQTGGTPDADIDAPEAWDRTTGSTNVIVGVIDTGIDYNHPDLAANMWENPGEAGALANNGIDDDGNGFIDDSHGWDFYNDDNDAFDDHYHGTHCAGTIGGVGNNSVGVAGVCWTVRLVPLKFLSGSGSGYTSDAVDAVYYATRLEIDLTSNSWGGGGYSQTLYDAIEDANRSNKLFVAAAGNSYGDNDVSPHYPSSYTNDNIIAVVATDHNDQKASFSCYGAVSTDLGAPGVDIYSTKPNNTYGNLSGTSMATPHVAGACALALAYAPGASHLDVKELMLTATDPVSALSGRCVSEGRLNIATLLAILNSPLVRLTDIQVDDSAGNSDGFANPGETLTMAVTLRNVGAQDATNLEIAVTTSDADVSITPASRTYGDLAGGSETTPSPAFNIVIDAGISTPHTIDLEIVSTVDGGLAWTNTHSFTIYTPCTISGTITRRASGLPIENAEISYTGPISGVVTSAVDGTYVIPSVDGSYTLTAAKTGYADGETAAVTVPPDAVVNMQLGVPEMTFTPASAEVTLFKNAVTDLVFEVSNPGDAQLEYAFISGTYTWSDSDDSAGPVYNWIDISASGTPVSGLYDDSSVGPITLPFSFPFYGDLFNQVRICGNGFLSFTDTSTRYSNTDLPASYAPDNMIAFFWDDLIFTYGGAAYYEQVDSETFVVQFEDVPYYSAREQFVTCQVILKASGDIIMQYQHADITDSCTIGLQDETGTNGFSIAYNEPYVHDNLAIRFSAYGAPWARGVPEEGFVEPGTTSNMLLRISSLGMMANTTYTTTVGLVNRGFADPELIPVTLTIEGNPVNHTPTASNIMATCNEDSYVYVTLQGSDADDDPLYYSIIDQPSNGVLYGSGNYYNYDPGYNYHGTDTFTYVVNDLEADSNIGVVTVAVQSVNDLPYGYFTAPSYGSLFEEHETIPCTIYAYDNDNNITEIQVMTNGTVIGVATNTSSSYYAFQWTNAPVGSHYLQARIIDEEGGTHDSSTLRVEVADLLDPVYPPNVTSGLNYRYYEGTWSYLPAFSNLTPVTVGTCTNFDVTLAEREDYWAMEYTGFIDVPYSGMYTFYLNSDDGSKLYIGNTEVVDNDGEHGPQERAGQIGLEAGMHPIRVTFLEAWGGQLLEVRYYTSGMYKRLVPPETLYRDIGEVTNPTVTVTAPANGSHAHIGTPLPVVLNAYDGDGTLTSVQVLGDDQLLGDAAYDTGNSYVFAWTNVGMGCHYIAGVATDDDGNVTTSSWIEVGMREPLPAPWTNIDIGPVRAEGFGGYDSTTGVFTVDGSGDDIWNGIDDFHYVYRTLEGDGEAVVRVLSMEHLHEWSKAGLMIRNQLTAGSPHAFMTATPSNGVAFQWRTESEGTSYNTNSLALTFPCWLKIERRGDLFTGSASGDGLMWIPIGSTAITGMNDSVYVGLGVLAHDDGRLCTAEFDGFALNRDLPIISVEATVPDAHEYGLSNGLFTISRQGSNSDPLPVYFSISGSAAAGVDYEVLSNSTVIAAGQASANLPVIPLEDDLAEGDEEIVLTLTPNAAYVLGTPAGNSVMLHDRPADDWRTVHFTAEELADPDVCGDGADPDGDGMPNLLEYAFDEDPRTPAGTTTPFTGQSRSAWTNGLPYPTITYRRRTGPCDVTYTVEGSSNLHDWSPRVTVSEEVISIDDTSETVTTRVVVDPDWSTEYIRLRVERDEE